MQYHVCIAGSLEGFTEPLLPLPAPVAFLLPGLPSRVHTHFSLLVNYPRPALWRDASCSPSDPNQLWLKQTSELFWYLVAWTIPSLMRSEPCGGEPLPTLFFPGYCPSALGGTVPQSSTKFPYTCSYALVYQNLIILYICILCLTHCVIWPTLIQQVLFASQNKVCSISRDLNVR